MWSPLAERPPRSVAPASTSADHQSERLGGTWIPTSGISRRHSPISLFISSIETGAAQLGGSSSSPSGGSGKGDSVPEAGASLVPSGEGAESPHLSPAVLRVRDEVLEDHLLKVPMPLMGAGQRLQRGDALVLGLADADQDPGRERDPQLARRFDRRQ